MKKTIVIEGMHCEHCVSRVTKALSELGKAVKVDLKAGKAVLDTAADNETLKNAVEDLGFDVIKIL